MAEINLHPDDTVMSGPEVVKKAGGPKRAKPRN